MARRPLLIRTVGRNPDTERIARTSRTCPVGRPAGRCNRWWSRTRKSRAARSDSGRVVHRERALRWRTRAGSALVVHQPGDGRLRYDVPHVAKTSPKTPRGCAIARLPTSSVAVLRCAPGGASSAADLCGLGLPATPGQLGHVEKVHHFVVDMCAPTQLTSMCAKVPKRPPVDVFPHSDLDHGLTQRRVCSAPSGSRCATRRRGPSIPKCRLAALNQGGRPSLRNPGARRRLWRA